MSALGEGLGRALARITTEQEPPTFQDEVRTLKAQHGGVSGLARYLGVHRTTVQRWQNSKIGTPRPTMLGRINTDYRRVTVPLLSRDTLMLGADIDGRQRRLTPDQLRLAPDVLAHVRQVWITTGDEEAAAAVLWAGIGDNFYKSALGDESLYEYEYEDFTPELDDDYCATTVSVST